MKWQNGIGIGIVAALLVALVGCGGQGAAVGGPTRGEGDIPIGRARVSRGAMSSIRIDRTSGTSYGTVDASGTVWAAPQESGPAAITFEPQDAAIDPVTIPITFGAQQSNVFDASVSAKAAGAVVRGITVDLVGPMPIQVGQSYTIRVRVDGANLNGAKPTIWVNGGVGALGSNDRFTVTASGVGEIRAELFGVQGSTSVLVP